jgi:hypothetical protein
MATPLFALLVHQIVKTSNGLNFCVLLCGNNAMIQKTVHSSMACYVHVLLHNAAKQMFHNIKLFLSLNMQRKVMVLIFVWYFVNSPIKTLTKYLLYMCMGVMEFNIHVLCLTFRVLYSSCVWRCHISCRYYERRLLGRLILNPPFYYAERGPKREVLHAVSGLNCSMGVRDGDTQKQELGCCEDKSVNCW